MTTRRRRARTSHGYETRLHGCTRRMLAFVRKGHGSARRMRGCARTSTISEHQRVIGEICTRLRPCDACKPASAETRGGTPLRRCTVRATILTCLVAAPVHASEIIFSNLGPGETYLCCGGDSVAALNRHDPDLRPLRIGTHAFTLWWNRRRRF